MSFKVVVETESGTITFKELVEELEEKENVIRFCNSREFVVISTIDCDYKIPKLEFAAIVRPFIDSEETMVM